MTPSMTTRIEIALLFLAILLTPYQARSQDSKLIEEGQRAFAEHCAGCHGGDADGTDMGPKLVGSRSLRARPDSPGPTQSELAHHSRLRTALRTTPRRTNHSRFRPRQNRLRHPVAEHRWTIPYAPGSSDRLHSP